MLALAAPVAAAYREPHLAPIICALALSLPLSSLAAVQQALMERDSQFLTPDESAIWTSGGAVCGRTSAKGGSTA